MHPTVARLAAVAARRVTRASDAPAFRFGRASRFGAWPATQNRVSTTAAISCVDKIHTKEQAIELVNMLSGEERQLLLAALQSLLLRDGETGAKEEEGRESPLDQKQTRDLFLVNALPFIGFGCLDNMIMIIAGEYIDQSLGAALCLSTMAAAALGNLISDVAGVGLAHYVELLVGKVGIKQPALTAKQLDSSKARVVTNGARAFGLSVGCLIGMFPLLFYPKEDDKEEKSTQ